MLTGPTSYFLPPTSYLLLPTSYFLPPTSYLLLPTSYFLQSCSRVLLPTSYFLLVLLPTSYFLLPTSHVLLPTVVLTGPWPVLASGACLVDLPGVRDANAARANVAASYLQNCSCIWIVAPIKRAVDEYPDDSSTPGLFDAHSPAPASSPRLSRRRLSRQELLSSQQSRVRVLVRTVAPPRSCWASSSSGGSSSTASTATSVSFARRRHTLYMDMCIYMYMCTNTYAHMQVSFICTQTDDCEPTEIMRDHADVAYPRWGSNLVLGP